MPSRTRIAAAGIAAVAALGAGCGTTVSGVGTTVGGSASSGGLSAPTGASAAGQESLTGPDAAAQGPTSIATSPGSDSGVSGSGSGAAGVGATSATGSGASASSGTKGAAGVPTTGRGYDTRKLFLGFPTNTDVSRAAPSGIGATNFGDQVGIIKAVVNDVNKHGGILGRTVVPVFHDIATADLETDPSTAAQATCTALTQDNHVVAVVNIVASIDLPVFYACLAKHDTPLISAGFIPADGKFFATYAPYLYKLTAASFTQLAPIWVERLIAMGYFHGWDATNGAATSGAAKIGLLYPGIQPQQRIFADIKQRLTRAGYPVVKEYQYDVSSLDAESASMGNAVLQMRNAGVTHILSSESDALLFMEAADSQHYRPRYALTSYHAPAVQLQGTVPSTQLVGSMGVGWLPTTDVDSTHNPGPVSAGEVSCRKIMRAAGQDVSAASAAIVAFAICDGVRLVTDGLSLSKDPSSTGLHAGLAGLHGAFESALTWRDGLSPSRYDLPGSVRDFAFKNGAYAYGASALHPL